MRRTNLVLRAAWPTPVTARGRPACTPIRAAVRPWPADDFAASRVTGAHRPHLKDGPCHIESACARDDIAQTPLVNGNPDRLEDYRMDPNPDYDASDEIQYFVNAFAWILRGVYPPPAYSPSEP